MPIKFRCHHCRQMLGISQTRAGAIVDCPGCGRSLQVPLVDGISARPTTPATLRDTETKDPDPDLLDALLSLADLNSNTLGYAQPQETSGSGKSTSQQSVSDKKQQASSAEQQPKPLSPPGQQDSRQTDPLQDALKSLILNDDPQPLNSQQTASRECNTAGSRKTERYSPAIDHDDSLLPVPTTTVETAESDDPAPSDHNSFRTGHRPVVAGPAQSTMSSPIRLNESPQSTGSAFARPAAIQKKSVAIAFAVGIIAGLFIGLVLSNSPNSIFFSKGSPGQLACKSPQQPSAGVVNHRPSVAGSGSESGERPSTLIAGEVTSEGMISGRVTWLDINEIEHPDQQALLLVLPIQNPSRLRLDGTSLRELLPNTEQSAVAAALKELGAYFVRADDHGAFSFSVHNDVSYTLVAVSRHKPQGRDFEIAEETDVALSRFFQSSTAITGRLQSQAIPVPAGNNPNRIIDVRF